MSKAVYMDFVYQLNDWSVESKAKLLLDVKEYDRLMDLYEATEDEKWLDYAKSLAEKIAKSLDYLDWIEDRIDDNIRFLPLYIV